MVFVGGGYLQQPTESYTRELEIIGFRIGWEDRMMEWKWSPGLDFKDIRDLLKECKC